MSRERTPPVDMPVIPAPVDATKLYDMTGNNEWANNAGIWLETWMPRVSTTTQTQS